MEPLKRCFAFFLGRSPLSACPLSIHLLLGSYHLHLSDATPYQRIQDGDRELVLYGYAVDVNAPSSDWCRETLTTAENVDDVFTRSQRLGGKYILFLRWGDALYCMGDATTSAPIFFDQEGNCASSLAYFPHPQEHPAYMAIRSGSDLAQSMPNDITKYANIRQLLPNHYVCVDTAEAKRLVLLCSATPLSALQTAEQMTPWVMAILSMYASRFQLSCPITSGKDSRVVLAALNRHFGQNAFPCFTMDLSALFSFDPQDVNIPCQMAAQGLIRHCVLPGRSLPESMLPVLDAELGVGCYSHKTATIAWTIYTQVPGLAILTGDILGQVGKCSLHRDLPEPLATPGYFRCKLHNFSAGAKEQLRLWQAETQASDEQMNLYDLFSIESRLGRWASLTGQMYDLLGIPYFNLFNSAQILSLFARVSRKERMTGNMHEALLRCLDASLISFPYGQDKTYAKLAKSCWPMFYLATRIKYLAGYTRFCMRGRKA